MKADCVAHGILPNGGEQPENSCCRQHLLPERTVSVCLIALTLQRHPFICFVKLELGELPSETDGLGQQLSHITAIVESTATGCCVSSLKCKSMCDRCCLVIKSCLTLRDPMDQSTSGPPVLHCLLELGQIHVGSFDVGFHVGFQRITCMEN